MLVVDIALHGTGHQVAQASPLGSPATQVATGNVDERRLDELEVKGSTCGETQPGPQMLPRENGGTATSYHQQSGALNNSDRVIPLGKIDKGIGTEK